MGLLDWLKQIGSGRKKLPYKVYVRVSCLTSYSDEELEKFLKDPKKVPKELPVKNEGMVQFYKQSFVEAPERHEIEMALKIKRLHLKSLDVAQRGLEHGDPLEVAAEILTINPFDFTTVVGIGTAYNQAKRNREFKVADYIKDTLNAYLNLHGHRTTFEEVYVYYDPRFRARDLDPDEIDAKLAKKKMEQAAKEDAKKAESDGTDSSAIVSSGSKHGRDEGGVLSSASMISAAVSMAGERGGEVRPELVEASAMDSTDDDAIRGLMPAHAAHTSPEITAELLDNGIPAGLVLDGCVIDRIAGKGGMGIVYKAHHEHLDRDVAVKVLNKDFAANAEQVRRFQEEARAAAKIEHPNIVAIYNFGICCERPYMIMQWVEAGSMQHILDRLGGQPMDVPDALRLVSQSARGLHAAHKVNIVHRDIKPDNLLVTEEGLVKIADFGLAKKVEADAGMSVSGTILGTPAYMPPEQAQADEIDFRADIYSLGVTLFHAVTGTVPFKGQLMRVLYQHITDPLPSARTLNPAVSPELDDFIHYLTAKKPDDRPQSMEEVADTLDIFLNPSLKPSASDVDISMVPADLVVGELGGDVGAGMGDNPFGDFPPAMPTDGFGGTIADAPAPVFEETTAGFSGSDDFGNEADFTAAAGSTDPFGDPFGESAASSAMGDPFSASPDPFADAPGDTVSSDLNAPSLDFDPAGPLPGEDPFGADLAPDPFASAPGDTIGDTAISPFFSPDGPGLDDFVVRDTMPMNRELVSTELSANPFGDPFGADDPDDTAATLPGARSSDSNASGSSGTLGDGGFVSPDITPDMLDAGLKPGMVIGGCRIDRQLGKGGMGIVYLAVQEQLDRNVALKVLNAQFAEDEIQFKRFKEEARSAAKLEHPNVIQVHTFGVVHNHPYLVMQFVEGESLQDRIRSVGPLPVADLVDIFSQAASGLAAAHKRAIIHRDVKPDNLMITTDGVVKVADFGLAKQTEADTNISVSGTVLGTPAYMPPEQARNESGDIDFRADIYALGMSLFHAATGTVPFKGSLVQVLFAQISQPLPDPRDLRPDLPAALVRVIMRMCEKDREQRFASMDDVKLALQKVLDPNASALDDEGFQSSTVEIAKGLADFDFGDSDQEMPKFLGESDQTIDVQLPADALDNLEEIGDELGFGSASAALASPPSGRMDALDALNDEAPNPFGTDDFGTAPDANAASTGSTDVAPNPFDEAMAEAAQIGAEFESEHLEDAANPFAEDAPDFGTMPEASSTTTAEAVSASAEIGIEAPEAPPESAPVEAADADAQAQTDADSMAVPSASSETSDVELPAAEMPPASRVAPKTPPPARMPEPEPVAAGPRLAWELVVAAIGGVFLLLASCSPLATTPDNTRESFAVTLGKLEAASSPPSASRSGKIQLYDAALQSHQISFEGRTRDDKATEAVAQMAHLVSVDLAAPALAPDETTPIATRCNRAVANPTPWNVARLSWFVKGNADWFAPGTVAAANWASFVLVLMPMVALVLIGLPFMFQFRGKPWLAWLLTALGTLQIAGLFVFVVAGGFGMPIGGGFGSGAWFALLALISLVAALGIGLRSVVGRRNATA